MAGCVGSRQLRAGALGRVMPRVQIIFLDSSGRNYYRTGTTVVPAGLSRRQAGQCRGRLIKPICWPLSVMSAPSSRA